jgi:hypothetical protein
MELDMAPIKQIDKKGDPMMKKFFNRPDFSGPSYECGDSAGLRWW